MYTHSWTVCLVYWFDVCFIEILIPFDVSEKVDFELMFGVKGMPIHGGQCKRSFIRSAKVDEDKSGDRHVLG
jgi:hypothetical protein